MHSVQAAPQKCERVNERNETFFGCSRLKPTEQANRRICERVNEISPFLHTRARVTYTHILRSLVHRSIKYIEKIQEKYVNEIFFSFTLRSLIHGAVT